MCDRYEFNDRIDNYINTLVSNNLVKSFYPKTVSKTLNIPLTSVLDRLKRFVDDDVLELKYEIRCHEDSNIIMINDNYAELLRKELYCRICDDMVEIDLDNIFPLYYIKNDYREYVKKKSLRSVLSRQSNLLVTTV